ncbi:acyltransferase family protein [Fretibacter rubidus]|uniref:acyltransferase family protein n=1 Tax=Fretibacter rubidus TaxID=570162 RepID=UPI003529ED4F
MRAIDGRVSIVGTQGAKTLYNIQALRAIAALLVVFAHLPGIELKHSPDQILPSIVMLGISGVDLFFVISGFIMVYVTWNTPHNIRNVGRFLFARFTRIYPVYWLIAVLVYIAWRLRPELISFDPDATNLWRSFLLLPDQTYPMLKVAWTLIHELYFYLIFALCLCLPKRFLMVGLTVWAAAIVLLQNSGFCPLSPTWRLMINPMGLEFYMGAVIGWLYMRRDDVGPLAWPILILGVLAFMLALIYQSNIAVDPFPNYTQRTVLFGIPSALIVYGIVNVERRGAEAPQSLSTIGNWSYALYLSHVLTLSALGYLWAMFAGDRAWDNIFILPIMVVISTMVSSVVWYGFEKPLLRYFGGLRQRLFGAGS